MARKDSMAVPEGNIPIPHVWISGTLEDLRRIMSEAMNQAFDNHFEQKPENPEDLRTMISAKQASRRTLGSHVLPW